MDSNRRKTRYANGQSQKYVRGTVIRYYFRTQTIPYRTLRQGAVLGWSKSVETWCRLTSERSQTQPSKQQQERFQMIVAKRLYPAGAVIALGLALGPDKYIDFVNKK